MASALFACLMASGGVVPPPKFLEATGHMTMKFLPDVMLNKEARNQKKIVMA